MTYGSFLVKINPNRMYTFSQKNPGNFRAPDDQPIKAKMLQSTTLKEIEKVTDGIHMKVQASELNEIQEKDIEEQLRKTLRI